MSILMSLLVSPVLLLISIPLVIFATFTTTFAISTLFFRVLMVYAELAAVLLQNQFGTHTTPKSSSAASTWDAPNTEAKHVRRKSRRGSVGSGSSNGDSTTPKAPESSGLSIYSGGNAARDFEGVGGWKIPGPNDEDALWTNMYSRLELPAMVEGLRRNHHRSRTSGSLTSMQLPTKSPVSSRARTPTSTRATGSTSPEEYFGNRASSKSTTSLDTANVGKTLLRHKPSISSGSSQSSARTLHLTISNT